MAYNIDETLAQGESGHIAHHAALAVATNDLDSRMAGVEEKDAIFHVDDIEDVFPGDFPVDSLIIQRAV